MIVRYLREKQNPLFALGLALALVTAAIAPFLHAMLAVGTPWRSADLAKYDLLPDPATLLLYHVGHWSATAAGLLGALLLLATATGMRWYEGVPLGALALVLAYWNATSTFGSHLW
jgi:hypothetical protein